MKKKTNKNKIQLFCGLQLRVVLKFIQEIKHTRVPLPTWANKD